MTATQQTYLVEYYTKNPTTGETGWDIHFAWIMRASSNADARQQVKGQRNFDCVISCDEANLHPLACDPKKIHMVR